MYGATDRISLETRPFRDVHSAIAGKNPHVGVERSETRYCQQLATQNPRTGVYEQVGGQIAHRRYRVRMRQRTEVNYWDSLSLAIRDCVCSQIRALRLSAAGGQ